jgi:predicted amidohydrolase
MESVSLRRRQFNKFLLGSLLGASWPGLAAVSNPGIKPAPRLRVAAIQMAPRLGDMPANLAQAEQLIKQAIRQGAEWIILPEMFTTAAAFHPALLQAIAPLDGAPARLMQRYARRHQVVIGGSFLARHDDGQVYNSFLLNFPDGSTFRHDKDDPTYWENCFYRGGKDDGVLQTPAGAVGSALCWELIRSRTARRLLGKVNMVVGGSCWWTLPDDADADSPLRAANYKMMREAAPRIARLLGVPVVHAAHAGRFSGFFSPDLPDVAYDSSYLGEAMIVAADGQLLARRPYPQGPGVVVANLDFPSLPHSRQAIPARFWLPPEMPQAWKESWSRWFKRGRDYYEQVTLPFLNTGEINEYIPEYMQGMTAAGRRDLG